VRNQTAIWVGLGISIGIALGMWWHNLFVGAAIGSGTGLMVAVAIRDSKPTRKRPRYGFRDDDRPTIGR
jgi:hypothetical protein